MGPTPAPPPRSTNDTASLTRPGSFLRRWRGDLTGATPALLGPASVVALGAVAGLLVILNSRSLFEAVLVAAALAVVPGAAVLPRAGQMDVWIRVSSAVVLSITIEVLVSLAMIWTGLWHPRAAGFVLLLLGAVAVAVRTAQAQFNWRPGGQWLARVRGVPSGKSSSAFIEHTQSSRPEGPLHSGRSTWWDDGAAAVLTEAESPTSTLTGSSDESGSRGGGTLWAVVLDDGQRLDLRAAVTVGRRPGRLEAGREPLADVVVDDPALTVSRRHLRLEPAVDGVLITDLGSLNGTVVTAADGSVTRCVDGEGAVLMSGDTVSFGEHWLLIESPRVA